MHYILKIGYKFPEPTSPICVPSTVFIYNFQILKTEEQLEKEDKEAHGAKLENLLRIGTPDALHEANDLMKIMSGYV
jgi:ADP-ribosylation factor-binding protein GGA